jgi:hypothetical protein
MDGDAGACVKQGGTDPPETPRMDAVIKADGAMTREQLAAKVAWEGGAFDALRYGVRSDQIEDAELRQLWQEMERLYRGISPIAWRIDSLLEHSR